MCRKSIVILLILAVFLFPVGSALSGQIPTIGPKMGMTSMAAWMMLDADIDDFTIRLAKLHYLMGFLDAANFSQMAKELSGSPVEKGFENVLLDLEGMTIYQLADTLEKIYEDYPEHRDRMLTPGFLIIFSVPLMRKGLPPFPPQEKE